MINTYFSKASVNDLKRGYSVSETGNHICLLCGKQFERDVVYQINDRLCLGQKAIYEHIKLEHNSVFEYLLGLDRKQTGLSDSQQEILLKFYKLSSDAVIAKEMGVTRSTVRNYRFRLKEKAKQAKIFLALMELLESNMHEGDKLIDFHKEATMIDERYAITETERKATIERYFNEQGRIINFPRKQKRKIIVLLHIAQQFEPNRNYTEKEVNLILDRIYEDYASLRRYLIQYGFLKRTDNGSKYWLTI